MAENDQTGSVARAMAAADAAPDDVGAQIAAAWACDGDGEESDAVRYYDAAWRLGVPAEKRRNFMVGYGSTLRNVGRFDESIEILRSAAAEFAGFAPLHAFLALTLHSAGRHGEAMWAAMTAVLDADADSGALAGYDRAIRYYRGELVAADRGDDGHRSR